MQHVHSKEHDINCIVFPQNDPWEHAAIQLRVRPTNPGIEWPSCAAHHEEKAPHEIWQTWAGVCM